MILTRARELVDIRYIGFHASISLQVSYHLPPKIDTSMDKATKLIIPIRSRSFRSFEGLRKPVLYNVPQLPRRVTCV
jgi:hypothetical protein